MKTIEITQVALEAAAIHIVDDIANRHTKPIGTDDVSVYAAVFKELMKASEISQEEFHDRIRAYVDQVLEARAREGIESQPSDAAALTGNLIKESGQPNMSQKVFKKLIKAVFPAES